MMDFLDRRHPHAGCRGPAASVPARSLTYSPLQIVHRVSLLDSSGYHCNAHDGRDDDHGGAHHGAQRER